MAITTASSSVATVAPTHPNSSLPSYTSSFAALGRPRASAAAMGSTGTSAGFGRVPPSAVPALKSTYRNYAAPAPPKPASLPPTAAAALGWYGGGGGGGAVDKSGGAPFGNATAASAPRPHPSPYPLLSQQLSLGQDAPLRPHTFAGAYGHHASPQSGHPSSPTESSVQARSPEAAHRRAARPTSSGVGSPSNPLAPPPPPSSSSSKRRPQPRVEEQPIPAATASATTPTAPQDEDTQEGTGKPRKRRRVVVACDTCRRKKIRCVGLPNASNTCNNCEGMGYTCTFTVDQDRSRGKYEILEAKVDALLSALRGVAPHVAAQYERGELNVTVGAGTTTGGPRARQGSSGRTSEASRDDDEMSAELGARGTAAANASGDSAYMRRAHMLPDIEVGRPRYFGASSNLNDFHGLESRAASPGAEHGDGSRAASGGGGSGSGGSSNNGSGSVRKGPLVFGLHHSSGDASGTPSSTDRRVLPKPQILYPTESREWVHNLRKRNLCGIGRDDAGYLSDAFVNRYHLPERDLLDHLLDLYFQHLNPLMPILNRQLIDRDLSLGRAIDDVAFRGLLFAVLAIAARFSSDPRVLADPMDPTSAGNHFAAASRLYHQVHSASLINVQVMLLTATFSSNSLGSGFSWTTLGAAVRALIDIGMHQERTYLEFCPAEQELRRRTFWGAYVLETTLSVTMGRPPALRLEDCDVRMPMAVSDSAIAAAQVGPITADGQDASLMHAFNHLISLSRFAAEACQLLYAPGDRKPEYKHMAFLIRKLDEMSDATPAGAPKLLRGFLECGRHDLRLYVLRPFLRVSPHLRQLLLPQCVDAARSCLRIVIDLHAGGELSDFFFVFLQNFLSSVTFMITSWHRAHAAELERDGELIGASLKLLDSLDARFMPALLRRAHRLLCRIAARLPASSSSLSSSRSGSAALAASPSSPASDTLMDASSNSPLATLATAAEAGRSGRRRETSGPSCAPPQDATSIKSANAPGTAAADRTGGGVGASAVSTPGVGAALTVATSAAAGPAASPSLSSPSAMAAATAAPLDLGAGGHAFASSSSSSWMGSGSAEGLPGASSDRAWEGFFERFLNDVETWDGSGGGIEGMFVPSPRLAGL